MSVPFTQYLQIELAPNVEEKAKQILAAGYRFEAELLRTGQVYFTIMYPKLELDVDIVVCHNGPEVPEQISMMIMRFDPTKEYLE